jgi:general secretion pathway protein I
MKPSPSGAETQRGAAPRGFTLIEVLAALVIVALGMLGVIQAVTQTARNGTYLREKTLAHWVAMNVITEQRLQPSPPNTSEASDEVELAGQRWRWTLTVTQTSVESMRRMDVAVRAADKPDGDPLAIVTGFYGSAIGAPGTAAPIVWTGGQDDGGGNDDEGGGDGNGNGSGNGSGSGSGSGSNQGGSGDAPKSPIKRPRPEPDEGDQ